MEWRRWYSDVVAGCEEGKAGGKKGRLDDLRWGIREFDFFLGGGEGGGGKGGGCWSI